MSHVDEWIEELLASIYYAILSYRCGKLYEFIDAGNLSPHEEHYSCFFDLLGIIPDFCSAKYNEEFGTTSFYLSYRAMQDYYRLCRVYGILHHVRLKENPYMKEAESFVYRSFDWGDNGGYAVYLQTRINHEWASGIVFQVDENYFCGETYLIETIIEIKEWYQQKTYELRKLLLMEWAIWLPALPAHTGRLKH